MDVLFSRMLRPVLTGLLVLGLAGCAVSRGHENNRQQAESRFRRLRAGITIPMLTQQIECGDLEQARRTVEDALRIDPLNARYHLLAGRIDFETGRLERSFHNFTRSAQIEPKLAAAHYYRGLVFQRWRKFDRAHDCYARAFELERDRPSYLLAMGEMLVALDRVDDARELFRAKLDYFEHNAGLRLAVGQLYAIGGSYDTAVRYLREAHLLRPNDMQILEELATAQLAAGRAEEAIRSLRHLLEQPSHSDRIDLQRALATSYLKTRRMAEARVIFMRLTRVDPSDHEAWIKLGEMAWIGGDTSAALQAARRVAVLAPMRPEGYLLAGMVWQKRGQITEALRMFKKADDVAPAGNEPALLRGIALQADGQFEAAAQAYAEALRRRPEDQRAQELLDRVSGAD